MRRFPKPVENASRSTKFRSMEKHEKTSA